MDALEQAREAVAVHMKSLADEVEPYNDDDGGRGYNTESAAHLLVALALAEQLKRIADMMEHPNRIIAPDPQDYYSINDYNEAAEQHDYWKNSRIGETMNEYKARIAQPANGQEQQP